MPQDCDSESVGSARSPAAGADGAEDLFSFLRGSHIFSSAVREVLDLRSIQEASSIRLTVPQIRLLRLLCRNGPHRLGRVAAVLGVSPPAAVRTVDRLERLDLVLRAPSPGDRRGKILAVSTRGRSVVQKFEESRRARVARLFEHMGPGELVDFARISQQIGAFLYRNDPPAGGHCLRCDAHIEKPCAVADIIGGCGHDGPVSGRGRRRKNPPSGRANRRLPDPSRDPPRPGPGARKSSGIRKGRCG